MPNGAATKCKAGDVVLTAGDAGKVLTASDFPFKSAKQVADDGTMEGPRVKRKNSVLDAICTRAGSSAENTISLIPLAYRFNTKSFFAVLPVTHLRCIIHGFPGMDHKA